MGSFSSPMRRRKKWMPSVRMPFLTPVPAFEQIVGCTRPVGSYVVRVVGRWPPWRMLVLNSMQVLWT